LLLVAFDREAAEAMGVPVFWMNLLLLVMVSLTIVVSLSAVGNILVVAMLVTPAAAARLLTDRLPVMLGLSAAIGAMSGVAGLVLSYHANVAAGGTIVLVATGCFGLVWLLAPSHGAIASILARRRATLQTGLGPPGVLEGREAPIRDGR
jgi:manganese/iron transport system permease protein